MRPFVFALLLLGCSAVPNSDISVQYKKEARKLGSIQSTRPAKSFRSVTCTSGRVAKAASILM